MPGAQETMHTPVAFRLPPARFVQRFRLLEDLQIAHDPPPADSILPANARSGLCWRSGANSWNWAVASGVPALNAAAFGGPVGEPLQLIAVFPCQLKKFCGGHVRRFFSQKSFKPPLQVGAVPRSQPVTPSRNPVKLKRLPHRSCLS